MEWLQATLFFLVFFIFGALLLKLLKTSALDSSYEKRNSLFTPAEQSFLKVLNQAVATNALILGKVRVADVLSPSANASRSKWQKAFNKISSKHFDFLLCDPKDLKILCAIELNDKSHKSEKRKNRDAFLENACLSAGLPLIQILAKANYSIPEIQQLLLNTLEQGSK